jgi:hypothetical protein
MGEERSKLTQSINVGSVGLVSTDYRQFPSPCPPLGNHNALRYGRYTAEAIATRQAIRELLRDSSELLEVLLPTHRQRKSDRARAANRGPWRR